MVSAFFYVAFISSDKTPPVIGAGGVLGYPINSDIPHDFLNKKFF